MKKGKKRLTLSKETVRALDRELQQAAGGATTSCVFKKDGQTAIAGWCTDKTNLDSCEQC
jgi:hypothetical protein